MLWTDPERHVAIVRSNEEAFSIRLNQRHIIGSGVLAFIINWSLAVRPSVEGIINGLLLLIIIIDVQFTGLGTDYQLGWIHVVNPAVVRKDFVLIRFLELG